MIEIKLERRNLDAAEAVEYLLGIELTQIQREKLIIWFGVREQEIAAAIRQALLTRRLGPYPSFSLRPT